MREESHLDDMRSAIRGDFERLAERRGGQELMSVAPAAEPDAEPEEPAPDPAEPKGLDPAHEPEEEAPEPEQHEIRPPDAAEPVTEGEAAEPEPAEAEEEKAEPAAEPEETARRSWLDRLLGR
jgi:hypothetical protein